MKKIKLFLFIFILFIFQVLNSGCPHKHINTYVPLIPGSISGKVITYDNQSVNDVIVFLTKDKNLNNAILKTKTSSDGSFKFENLDPDFYYISAYKDIRGDGYPTIGEDYLGGSLITTWWDLEGNFCVEVKKATETNIDIPLLMPFKLKYIENGTSSIELNPKFEWTKIPLAKFYRLRIISENKEFWVIDTPLTFKIYGELSNNETEITSPTQLVLEKEYFWQVIAFKEKGVPIAYSELARFFVKRLRTDENGRIEIVQ